MTCSGGSVHTFSAIYSYLCPWPQACFTCELVSLSWPLFFRHPILTILDVLRPLRACAPLDKHLLGSALHIILGTFSSTWFLRYGFLPLDFSVMDFVPLGTFFWLYYTLSVPVPFPHIFPISNVLVPSLFVSLHSLNLVYFVLSIVLFGTSWFA